MLPTSIQKRVLFSVFCCLTALALVVNATTLPGHAEDITGRDLLSITRVAQGGPQYAGMQNMTIKAGGFVNMAAFAGIGANPLAGAVEVKLNLTDVQDKQGHRRLDVAPSGAMIGGPTYLVYTGTEGGGMFSGNPFRVTEVAASRHWAMMSFDTLNRAVEGQLPAVRQKDEGNNFVVEVKVNAQDTIRYWINKQTFYIDKAVTRYNGKVMVEEERSNYKKVDCMMLPFRVVTRLQGQRLADLTIESYDLKTEVPAAKFTITAEQ
jgi:hypothetical protein